MYDNDKLILDMMPHGKRWARRQARTWGDEEEFQSIASMAVVEACRAYNPTCGASLKTCCYRKVRSAFSKECLRRSTMRIYDMDGFPSACEMEPLEESFPERLQDFARKYLVEKMPIREIGRVLGVPRSAVEYMREEVENIWGSMSDA